VNKTQQCNVMERVNGSFDLITPVERGGNALGQMARGEEVRQVPAFYISKVTFGKW
jgi:hypothetical protein